MPSHSTSPLPISSKQCVICGVQFDRRSNECAAEFRKRTTCSTSCRNTKSIATRRERAQMRIAQMFRDQQKRCAMCEAVLPLTEFTKNAWFADGMEPNCRTCRMRKQREYYAQNPDRCRAYAQGFRARNPEKVKAYSKQYYAKNADMIRDRARRYFHANKERCRARAREWRTKNHERALQNYRRYNEQRRDQQRIYSQTRRAQMTPDQRAEMYWRHNHSPKTLASRARYEEQNREQRRNAKYAATARRARRLLAQMTGTIDRAKIIDRDGRTCYLCEELLAVSEITLDHVIPISRGGEHSEANLRVCCLRCNVRKATKLLSEIGDIAQWLRIDQSS